MSVIHLTFPSSLTSITAQGCRVEVVDCANGASGDCDSAAEQKVDDQAIGALNAIARRLGEMQETHASERRDLSDQVSQAATEIARAVLNDQELVQQRSLQFVQIAIEQLQATVSKTAYVHPTCVETIQSWIDQSDMELLEVAADDSVEPGDCRIDCGDRGVTATLDALLESMLTQSQNHH